MDTPVDYGVATWEMFPFVVISINDNCDFEIIFDYLEKDFDYSDLKKK